MKKLIRMRKLILIVAAISLAVTTLAVVAAFTIKAGPLRLVLLIANPGHTWRNWSEPKWSALRSPTPASGW